MCLWYAVCNDMVNDHQWLWLRISVDVLVKRNGKKQLEEVGNLYNGRVRPLRNQQEVLAFPAGHLRAVVN